MNLHAVEFEASYGISTQIPASNRPEIAFAGRSNVGKSSLINRLFNRKNLARVSSMPGKTATINFFSLPECHFVDLPGYGYAKVAKSEKHRWSELIEGYFNQGRKFALVMALIDIRHSPSQLDIDMVQYLIDRELPFIVVLTKADKLSKNQQIKQTNIIRKALHAPAELPLVPCSSEKGLNIDLLRSTIEEVVADF